MNAREWSRLEKGALACLLLGCALAAVTLPVNPYPEDGWFFSRSRILEHAPGGNNQPPVAVPAYFYAGTFALRKIAGWGLEEEFYLAAVLQQLLLACSGLLLYLTHRALGIRTPGLIASAALVLFLESTVLPQSFWSENLTIWMMTGVLFLATYLYQGEHLTESRFRLASLLFGLVLGMFSITRVVPLVILPAAIFLLRKRLPAHRANLFLRAAGAVTATVLLAAMSLNLYRYGRFELANSQGRNVWNVVSPDADIVLADSPEYGLLKQSDPNVQGKRWYQIHESDFVPELRHFTPEELFRKLTAHAIRRHPLVFLRSGALHFVDLLLHAPTRLGLFKARFNPLERDTLLPPLVARIPVLDQALELIHRGFTAVFPWLVCGIVIAAGAAIFVTRSSEHRPPLVFFLYVYLVCLYVIGQFEHPVPRYVLPYLPALALAASLSITVLIRAARQRSRT